MKVILLQNVPKLGQKGDIKEVSEGYGRNYLISRKLAKVADDASVKQVKVEKEASQKKEQTLVDQAVGMLAQIRNKTIIIKEKANEKGHLFAQVHTGEIADAIKKDLSFDISEDWIVLDKPIKEVGEFSVDLDAFGNPGKVKIKIEAQD